VKEICKKSCKQFCFAKPWVVRAGVKGCFTMTFQHCLDICDTCVSTLKINVLYNVAVLFRYQVTILNTDWWNTRILWFLHSENLTLVDFRQTVFVATATYLPSTSRFFKLQSYQFKWICIYVYARMCVSFVTSASCEQKEKQ